MPASALAHLMHYPYYNEHIYKVQPGEAMQPRPPRTGASDQSQALFRQTLTREQIEHYSSLAPEELKGICRESGVLFHRKLGRKPNQVLAFLSNYHQIILGYNSRTQGQLVNNLSLHFLILSSHAMLQSGQRHSAKNLLKKSLSYLASTDPDPVLLATALNNLTILRMQDGKYYKSVNVLLEAVGLMERHVRELKVSKKRGQIMEDSVILVNAYYLLSKCLLAIMQGNGKTFYRELYHYSSQVGIRKAAKYLGRESLLTQNFMKLVDDESIRLPIFLQEEEQRSTNEEKFLRALERIEKLLQAPREPVIIK